MSRLERFCGSKRFPVFLFLVFSLILFLVYSKYYFADQFPMSGDAVNFITELTHAANAVAGGEFPLWNKWLAGGISFLPSITVTFLLGILPIREAIYVLYIGMLALGSTFFFLYLREIGCRCVVSCGVSLCYLLSIHLGGARKSHTYIILAVALLPVILYFVEKYFSTRKLRWLLFSSAAMALQFYMGMLQIVFYTDLFLFVYLLAFGLRHRMSVKTMLGHGTLWGVTYLGLIALKLLPMLEQNAAFSQSGSARSSYEFFSSYSISPVKLIMALFPRFFGEGNVHQPLGIAFSSEMDIELFLGAGIALLVLTGLFLHIRNFRVGFFACAMAVIFAYAALGTFEPLGRFIYNIPYLGDFRVPSRALFLILFMAYVIAAVTLSKFVEEATWRRTAKVYCLISGTVALLVCGAVFTALMVLGVLNGFVPESYQGLAGYVKSCILPELAWIVGLLVLVGLLTRYRIRLKRVFGPALCLVLVGSAVLQTFPYTAWTEPCSVSALTASDAVSGKLKEEIGNYKVWDAFAGIDGVHESIISLNRGMSKQMACINAYTTFNNPNLYRLFTQEAETPMNSSGLLTGSMKAEQNVYYQNSLLSMLGVKYLIDSSGILAKENDAVQIDGDQSETVFTTEELVIANANGELSVTQDAFTPEAQTAYRIRFDCTAAEDQTLFYVDLYGGPEYDNAEQQVSFSIQAGEHSYSGLILSGESDSFPEIYWRIVTTPTCELEIHNFTIERLSTTVLENAYTPWDTESDPQIYVNQYARDVLYVPDAIRQIEDTEVLYRDTIQYDLDNVNYMEELTDRQLSPTETEIRDIYFKNNSITAEVTAQNATFINFSQCYYPGWKAYVDGVETKLYLVNGLIMGMEVPAGVHQIKFSYQPATFIVGATVSGGTLLLLAAAWVLKKKNFRVMELIHKKKA